MRKMVILLFMVGAGLTSFGEMRIWQDRKGNTLEAEYVCVVGGKVTLRDANKKDYRLPLKDLCQKDQTFLQKLIPPTVEIEFSKKQDRRKTSYGYATLDITCSVEITKKSRLPYDRELRAVMVVMGYNEDTNEYTVLDKAESKFMFKGKNKVHEFFGKRFRIHEYDKYYYGNNQRNVEYRGHLVVVYDPEGNPIEVKASPDKYEGYLKILVECNTGDKLSRTFRPLKDVKNYY